MATLAIHFFNLCCQKNDRKSICFHPESLSFRMKTNMCPLKNLGLYFLQNQAYKESTGC